MSTAAEQLVGPFMVAINYIPESITMTSAAMGYRGLQAIGQDQMTWHDFTTATLDGLLLEKQVSRATFVHDQLTTHHRIQPIPKQRIATILPSVFTLSRDRFIATIDEAAKVGQGRLLETTPTPLDADSVSRAEEYLWGDNGPAHTRALNTLTFTSIAAMRMEKARDIAKKYRDAILLGTASEQFPDGPGETIKKRKERAAEAMQLLVSKHLLATDAPPMSIFQRLIFAGNITRPY